MESSRTKRLFILIIILAAGIRLAGSFSFEKELPAEGNILGNSSYMWSRGTIEQEEYAYPSLYYYASFFTQKVFFYTLYGLGVYPSVPNFLGSKMFWRNVYITGRLISVIFTIILFFLLFRLALENFNETTALIATLFLAFSYIDVINSRLAKPDSLTNLIIFLSIFFSLKFYMKGKYKFLYLASLFVGLSISAKYFFIACFPLIFAVLLRKAPLKKRVKELFIGGGISILAFVLSCPYCIIDYKIVIKTFTGAQNFAKGYTIPVRNTYILVAKDLFHYSGYGIFLLLLIGIFFALKKDWKIHLIILSFSAVYLFMLSISKVYGPRYLLYLFPYISLYASYALVKLVKRRGFALALAILFVLPGAIPSLKAASWLAQGKTNMEIMNDFIRNSIPASGMITSYHAYKLYGAHYLFFDKFAKRKKFPRFFIFGNYEKYFCEPESTFIGFCSTFKKRLKHYYIILNLKDIGIHGGYAFDYPITLLKRRPCHVKMRKPKIVYPALVKLQGAGKFLFPGNYYVKDFGIAFLKNYRSFERMIFSSEKDYACVLVEALTKGSYNVKILSKNFKGRTGKIFAECERADEGIGKIDVKSEGAFLNVYVTSSPLNLAQILIEKSPKMAEKFLLKLKKNRKFYFEATRLLMELYKNTGREKMARESYLSIKNISEKFLIKLSSDFSKEYFKDGFDKKYIELSQRVYPEFKRRKRKSKPFYIFPGVYEFNKEPHGYILTDGEKIIPKNRIFRIDKPGWAEFILAEDILPMNLFFYFDPEKTLKVELKKLEEFTDTGK